VRKIFDATCIQGCAFEICTYVLLLSAEGSFKSGGRIVTLHCEHIAQDNFGAVKQLVESNMNRITVAKFGIGQVVRHRLFPFRGVIYDIDPEFDNTDEWYESIPEHIRPRKDQPFYHLLAENDETTYLAYVSEQNLVADTSGVPVSHPELSDWFEESESGVYVPRDRAH
jgi:heat shock protein HspQ